VKNIFYNHIATDRIDMIDKLAFVYWYEHMKKSGYKLTPKQTQMYEQVRHEVMDYGYEYFENNGN
jgi:hypothetical protein